MKAKEFIIELKKESKPRNFVAKNASLAGKAGQHKDKKKAEKQGDVKHKNKEYAEGTADEGVLSFLKTEPEKKKWNPTKDSRVTGNKKDNEGWIKLLVDKHRRGVPLTDREWNSIEQWKLKRAMRGEAAEIQELSTGKLALYKKAAGADAKKADADGDYARGDKRFKGINRATNKQFDNDAKKGVAEAFSQAAADRNKIKYQKAGRIGHGVGWKEYGDDYSSLVSDIVNKFDNITRLVQYDQAPESTKYKIIERFFKKYGYPFELFNDVITAIERRAAGETNRYSEQGVEEASLGDYREKALKQKAQSRMGAMFNDPDALATFNKRERGLNRLKARDEVARKSTADKQMADNIAKLPELKAEYERMKAEYKSLGGSNWQYADREQNLTDREREARSMEGSMNNLWRTISAAEKAQKSQGVGEGWKDKVAAAGLAGAMAFGAAGANARVTPGDDPSINRLTGKPIATQQATDNAPAKAEAPKGFSKEYLQAVVDGKHPRPMVSVEKAQQLLKQMDSKVGEGSMFAGAKVGHKEGPAGQWRNDGAKKNKAAKPGDLVGGGM